MKVAYNASYGGFALSEKAVRLAREIAPYSYLWKQIVLFGETYPDTGTSATIDFNAYHIDGIIPRHNNTLIEVIERLGKEANGPYANIQIEEIHGNIYLIDNYDGLEQVQTPDSIQWVIAE